MGYSPEVWGLTGVILTRYGVNKGLFSRGIRLMRVILMRGLVNKELFSLGVRLIRVIEGYC